ncbi:MAG: iron ABC transporter permease [Dysgonamonadaceae bacterium]|jgi:iron complex transport system permease protein|nr:iron ABC transporter permease [Dysgonamonadaceae bacterium]
MKKPAVIGIGTGLILLILFAANVLYGSVAIPASQVIDILLGHPAEKSAWTGIILYYRLPQAITALLSGAALAVSGLMLQTLFHNPLAGPSILGISNGANLGVAILLLAFGGVVGGGFSLNLSIVVAAFAGAFLILLLIVYISGRLKSNVLVLILGIMISYLTSSGIAILNASVGSPFSVFADKTLGSIVCKSSSAS